MGKPEGAIENYMREIAESMGFLFYKFQSPSQNGVPDRVAIGYGHTIFIELKKSEDEEPRPLQQSVINRMIDHGAEVFVIGSKEEAYNLLKAYANYDPPKPKKLKLKVQTFNVGTIGSVGKSKKK
jgi:hypothetical protein